MSNRKGGVAIEELGGLLVFMFVLLISILIFYGYSISKQKNEFEQMRNFKEEIESLKSLNFFLKMPFSTDRTVSDVIIESFSKGDYAQIDGVMFRSSRTLKTAADMNWREVLALEGKTEAQRKIITAIAENKQNVDPIVALALSKLESGFIHCKTGMLVCSQEDILQGKNIDEETGELLSTDWGVKQINDNAHPDQFVNGCAYNWECNIDYGLKLLRGLYDTYANNDELYTQTVISNCKNSAYQGLYLSYTGWERALRAYNGFGCNENWAKYVENIANIQERWEGSINKVGDSRIDWKWGYFSEKYPNWTLLISSGDKNFGYAHGYTGTGVPSVKAYADLPYLTDSGSIVHISLQLTVYHRYGVSQNA